MASPDAVGFVFVGGILLSGSFTTKVWVRFAEKFFGSPTSRWALWALWFMLLKKIRWNKLEV